MITFQPNINSVKFQGNSSVKNRQETRITGLKGDTTNFNLKFSGKSQVKADSSPSLDADVQRYTTDFGDNALSLSPDESKKVLEKLNKESGEIKNGFASYRTWLDSTQLGSIFNLGSDFIPEEMAEVTKNYIELLKTVDDKIQLKYAEDLSADFKFFVDERRLSNDADPIPRSQIVLDCLSYMKEAIPDDMKANETASKVLSYIEETVPADKLVNLKIPENLRSLFDKN